MEKIKKFKTISTENGTLHVEVGNLEIADKINEIIDYLKSKDISLTPTLTQDNK